jgi:hypothetical protein
MGLFAYHVLGRAVQSEGAVGPFMGLFAYSNSYTKEACEFFVVIFSLYFRL